jgi:hypothetical protein
VACHELDALADHVVGNVHGLLRIAGVVAHFENELLAVHAASGVDVGHGLFSALPQLFAKRGILTGDGAGNADDDVSERRRGGKDRSEAERNTLITTVPSAVAASDLEFYWPLNINSLTDTVNSMVLTATDSTYSTGIAELSLSSGSSAVAPLAAAYYAMS